VLPNLQVYGNVVQSSLDMDLNNSAESAALSRELTDYAAGVADTFGLSTAAIIAFAKEEHPGRPLARLHFQAIIRALHRAGRISRGEPVPQWR
jgi:hypothetical protein